MNPAQTLSTDGAWVTRIAWSPDGRRLAAGCGDNHVRVWDVETGEVTLLRGHTEVVSSVAWSPDGSRLASGSADHSIRIWNGDSAQEINTHSLHREFVRCVAWVGPSRVVSGGEDDVIYLTDASTSRVIRRMEPGEGWVLSVAVSPSGNLLAAGFATGAVALIDIAAWKVVKRLKGHRAWVDSVAWGATDEVLVSASGDKTIRIWNGISRNEVGTLERHTGQVRAVALSAGGRMLASKADGDGILLWDTRRWTVTSWYREANGHSYWPPGIAFHPRRRVLASADDGVVRLIDLASGEDERASAEEAVKYVAAKIALVGDSGVGKTSLGWRLAHGEFRNHASTHGQQFWVVDQLSIRRADATECEAVLWDFAGQPDYRLVHALFMDDVDLALVLFDPTKSLDGVRYWLKQLTMKGDQRRALLVAARTDRGAPILTQAELQAFCNAERVAGGFVTTSAYKGAGLDELLDRIRQTIDWESMPATITTATFKKIKEHVLALKEQRGETLLVTPAELRERLQDADPDWRFSDAEMMTAVKHLATHGYVSPLRASDGEEVILLAPELLASVASSIVLEARRNPKGLGAVDELFVLHDFQPRELDSLSPSDRKLLLDAAVVLFLKHNVCFRQTLGANTFLIFPALINEKRPQLASADVVDYVSYRVTGAVENVYASLVVQLGYTGTFARTNQWQNQAEYETATGDLCGFRQTEEAEGQIELVLYHAKEKPRAKGLFQELVEMFLRGRDLTIQKFPAVVCAHCGYRPQRAEIVSRITAGKDHLYCGECGHRIPIALMEEERPAATVDRRSAREESAIANRRTGFEAALVRIKAIARDTNRKAPSCFLSYAWGNEEEERWVAQLAADLQNAGIEVVLDRNDNAAIGANIARFLGRIPAVDFVAVVGTPRYLAKYENKVSSTGSVVAAEVDLINQRLVGTEERKATVLPLLLGGEESTSLPPLVRGKVYADFRQEANYFRALFDLTLTMYRIDRSSPAVADVRETLGRS